MEDATCGLHEQQESHDPWILGSPQQGTHTSRNRKALTRIPQDWWVEGAKRHTGGESLRELAKHHGVSHETMRQVLMKRGEERGLKIKMS